MKLAAIDIGTNSFHMVIVQVDRAGAFEVVDREKEMVGLGKGTLADGRLSEESIQKVLACLSKMKKLSKAHGCSYLVAAATSAVREADNKEELLERIYEETGLKVRVITGEQEAELIFRAVQDGMDLSQRKALVLDLGGGSLECVVGNSFGTHLVESLPIGVLRMTEEYAQNPGVTSPKRYKALAAAVRDIAGPVIESAQAVGFDQVVGTSGTFKCLGELLAPRRGAFGDVVHLPPLDIDELANLTQELQSETQEQRAARRKMNPKRAYNIAVGATIIHEILKLTGVKKATLSNRALRDGLVLEAIRSLPSLDRLERRGRDLRRRSMMALFRRFDGDRNHAAHVARLSLQLFDQTGGLHGLGSAERELLEYAAWLHDMGLQAGYTKHHKHGFYLLTNSELEGFDPGEVFELALIGRYHRKSLPSTDHEEFARLPKPRREVVSALAALLRIADGLDRTHRQIVKDLQVVHENDAIRIEISALDDVELELVAAARKHDLCEQMWGRTPTYSVHSVKPHREAFLELTEVNP